MFIIRDVSFIIFELENSRINKYMYVFGFRDSFVWNGCLGRVRWFLFFEFFSENISNVKYVIGIDCRIWDVVKDILYKAWFVELWYIFLGNIFWRNFYYR